MLRQTPGTGSSGKFSSKGASGSPGAGQIPAPAEQELPEAPAEPSLGTGTASPGSRDTNPSQGSMTSGEQGMLPERRHSARGHSLPGASRERHRDSADPKRRRNNSSCAARDYPEPRNARDEDNQEHEPKCVFGTFFQAVKRPPGSVWRSGSAPVSPRNAGKRWLLWLWKEPGKCGCV